MTNQKLVLGSGITLDYAERGDPAGLPVILLHGYTDSRRSYEPLLATLPAGLRLITMTHRGHGDSDKPATGYDMADLVGDVGQLMDALGIAQAVIVGHSMSSQVAQRFAAYHPERTRALILIGAFTAHAGNPEIEALWQGVSGLSDPVDPAFARDFQQSTLARPVPSWFFEMIVAECLKVPLHVWRAALAGTIKEDCTTYHAAISAPTLVLWGDKDPVSPRAQQELLATVLPDARLRVYGGVGHSPHWEVPHRAAADIATFLDGLVSARGRPAA